MSRVLVKILLAPIILPMIIVMSLLSLMITIVASVYENVAGLPMKLVGICILLALFTKSWLAACIIRNYTCDGISCSYIGSICFIIIRCWKELFSHIYAIEIILCLSVPHNFPIGAPKVPHWCIFSMDFGRVIFTMGQANGTQHRLQSPFSFAKE